jgi:hypothetical protein
MCPSGRARSSAWAAFAESVALTLLTTLPRLMGLRLNLCGTEYQFIKAIHAPVSLSAIHVPPPGSDGESTARPFTIFFLGGKPVGRVSFSSRFIPRA